MKRRNFIKHTNKTENKVKKEEEKCLKNVNQLCHPIVK